MNKSYIGLVDMGWMLFASPEIKWFATPLFGWSPSLKDVININSVQGSQLVSGIRLGTNGVNIALPGAKN